MVGQVNGAGTVFISTRSVFAVLTFVLHFEVVSFSFW
jgi:hypothetical protein